MTSTPLRILLMGVSGSGKTTVGRLLARQTGAVFLDADDFHPPANVEKMSAGAPLTDEDRAPWLEKIATVLRETPSFVLACSALKERYREVLQAAAPDMRLYLLEGTPELIHGRLSERAGHFMPVSLLESQLEALEIPPDAIRLDIADSAEKIVARICSTL